MIDTVDHLADTQAVAIIGVGISLAVDGSGGKPSALRPCKGIAGAVVVAQGVAGGIVGNGLPIESGKQVSPLGIAIGLVVLFIIIFLHSTKYAQEYDDRKPLANLYCERIGDVEAA